MAVSKDFLNKLDALMAFSDEPCLCSGIGRCRRCTAEMEIESIYSDISTAVERIQDIPQSVS